MAAKTVRVEILAQVVSSDGFPVNKNDEEYGAGWEDFTEWVKRRRPRILFCPTDLKTTKRRMSFKTCRCHKKFRLVVSNG